jgi:hypothetical protein
VAEAVFNDPQACSGVALCAILLELAASSVTKPVHEKAASYYAWDTIRPLGPLPIAFVG